MGYIRDHIIELIKEEYAKGYTEMDELLKELAFFRLSDDEAEALREWAKDNPPLINERQERCRHCAYLVEGDDGAWICDDCGLDILNIADDDCSANQEF